MIHQMGLKGVRFRRRYQRFPRHVRAPKSASRSITRRIPMPMRASAIKPSGRRVSLMRRAAYPITRASNRLTRMTHTNANPKTSRLRAIPLARTTPKPAKNSRRVHIAQPYIDRLRKYSRCASVSPPVLLTTPIHAPSRNPMPNPDRPAAVVAVRPAGQFPCGAFRDHFWDQTT